MGEIISLVYQPSASIHKPPYRYNRVPADTLNLVEGHGIEGDHKAGRSKTRHLNIMSTETVAELREEGFKTNPGELGEQIVISGINVAELPTGTQIQLGESAVIQITKPRTPCDWFALIQGQSETLVEGRVGMMAKVIASGTIKIGDSVVVREKMTSVRERP
jgi:MOSC domain-containing protein YiiM